ncbi:unnamed protein product [Calypogeia fissa]
MAKPAVLDLRSPEEYPPLCTMLESMYTYHQWWKLPQKEVFLAATGPSIRGIVTNASSSVTRDLVSKLPNLEIVASFSVGVDKVDLHVCKQNGVVVTNTPDVLTDAVAETSMALMLTTMRKICAADRFVRDGGWRGQAFPLTAKISGKRIGIVGLGRIGAAIARRAEAFDCRIGYWSRSEKKGLSSYKYFGSIVNLAKDSEVLIVACALTEETTRIINRKVLDALGPNGYLVNVARGLVVDERELVQALVEGRLAGAGLDVFEGEPHVPEELLHMSNVVLLPHVGTDTWETSGAMANLVIANLTAHFSGKPLLTPVS